MALGASSGRIQREVIFNTLRITLVGLVLGTIASAASAQLIASLLFATSPWDIASYAATMPALAAVALLSGYVPARRASSINPMTALRSQ
jgi:ABC-type antimicrobial peptide transport system permease subunit